MDADRVFELCETVGKLSSEPTEESYWLDLADGSQSEEDFCRSCAEERVKTLAARIDGGWALESDHLKECAQCGVRLRCWATDYAAREVVEHVQQHKPDTPEDWWVLRWAMEGLVSRDPLWEEVERLLAEWGLASQELPRETAARKN